jgi:hypothetical protein
MHICMEQVIECCVKQLESKFSNIYVLAIWRAPTGDFEHLLSKLDCIMNDLHKPKTEFICGDINTDFLTECHCKQCRIFVLMSFISHQL